MFNRATLIVLVIALAGGLGLLASQHFLGKQVPDAPALQAIKLFPQPRPLPDFALRQSDGTQLLPGELHGHWTLVFLGFTHCPDICPTTLVQLAQAQNSWVDLPEGIRPRVLFVSVDPERDTPAHIGEYAHGFHPDTLAATGDLPALSEFARSLSLVFMRAPAEEGAPADQYSVDHSSAIALLDPQGRMAGVIQQPLVPQDIASDLATLTHQNHL